MNKAYTIIRVKAKAFAAFKSGNIQEKKRISLVEKSVILIENYRHHYIKIYRNTNASFTIPIVIKKRIAGRNFQKKQRFELNWNTILISQTSKKVTQRKVRSLE